MLDQFFTYFRRFYPFINAGLIALLAFTLASVTNGYIGNKIDQKIIIIRQKTASSQATPDEAKEEKKQKRKNKRERGRSSEEMQQYISAVAKRNLFDAVTSTPKTPVADITAENADISTLNVQLLGTFVAVPEEYSWAIIEDKKAKNTDVYSIGMQLMGSATILKINRNEVILDNNGKTEVIYVFEDQEKDKPREPAGDDKPPEGDPALEVSKVDEDSYEIAREVFDGLQDNMTQLMTQARIVPYFKKGKIDGYKIFAIKKDSFYQNLGLKNGDIIQRVNGMDISSPEKALQMMQQLKSETSFQIDLTRKGQQRTFTYSVR